MKWMIQAIGGYFPIKIWNDSIDAVTVRETMHIINCEKQNIQKKENFLDFLMVICLYLPKATT